jgi:tetratricopeptide (TPR) repeat protein
MSRLRVLLVVAAVMLAVAGVTNYRYWRGRAARARAEAAAAAPRGPAPATLAEIAALSKRLETAPADTEARDRLAELYFSIGDFPHSLAELRVLAGQRPRDPDLALRQAMVLRLAARLPEAESAVRRALALRPKETATRELLAELCLDQGRAREALALFEECLRAQPESAGALLGKGRAMEELFRHHHAVSVEEMVRVTEKSLELDPKQPAALLVLARMKFAYLKRAPEAEKLALRAAALQPNAGGAYILLAEIALSYPATSENLKKAGEYAYEGGRRALRDPRPPCQVGRVYLANNQLDRAIQALEHSIELGPTPEAMTHLAVAYRRAGKPDRADHYAGLYQRYSDLMERRDALLRTVVRDRKAPGPYFDLASLYLQAGQASTAERWLDAASRLRPADPRCARIAAAVQEQRSGKRSVFPLPIP